MANSEYAITEPQRLVLIYQDGYVEIAKYIKSEEKFSHFETLNEKESETIRGLILKKEDKIFQEIPKEVDKYMDINNFSFIVKSHRRKLPFLKYTKEEKKTYVDTTLPNLYFLIKNNQIYPYVSHRNKIYYNPLPNITADNLCMGTADRSYIKEHILKKKIELIKSSFFESTFSHEIKFNLLQSWFDGKPDIKLLTEKKVW